MSWKDWEVPADYKIDGESVQDRQRREALDKLRQERIDAHHRMVRFLRGESVPDLPRNTLKRAITTRKTHWS